MEVAKESIIPAGNEEADHPKTWKSSYGRQRKQPEITFVDWMVSSSQKICKRSNPSATVFGSQSFKKSIQVK